MAKIKRTYKSQATRLAAVARGKKLAAQNKKKAEAELKASSKNWHKIAKDWLSKSGRKSIQKDGKTVPVYMQFTAAMRKEGASQALAVLLWQKNSPGTEYAKKVEKKPATKGKKSAATKGKKAKKPAAKGKAKKPAAKGKKASANISGSLKKKTGATTRARVVGKRMANGKMAYYKNVSGKLTRISKEDALKLRGKKSAK